MDPSAPTMPPSMASGTKSSGVTPSWMLATRSLTSGEAVELSCQCCLSSLLRINPCYLCCLGWAGLLVAMQDPRSSRGPSVAFNVVLPIPITLLTSRTLGRLGHTPSQRKVM